MTVTRPTIPNLYLILCPEDLFLSHTLRGILLTFEGLPYFVLSLETLQ